MNGQPEQRYTWKLLLSSTYGLYQEQFARFFRIALPAVLVAVAYRYFERTAVNPVLRTLWHSQFGWLVVISPLFTKSVYWLISGFFFGAVSCAVTGS